MYMIFVHLVYEANGGWKDFIGVEKTLHAAIKKVLEYEGYENFDIVNYNKLKVIIEGDISSLKDLVSGKFDHKKSKYFNNYMPLSFCERYWKI